MNLSRDPLASTVGIDAFEGSPAARTARERGYLIVFDHDSSHMFQLGAGEVVVGRGDDAGLRLRDGSVSRAHAKLVTTDEEVRVYDLGSHNGTLVNGSRIAGARTLVPGDVIVLGAVTLVFQRAGRAPGRRSVVEPAQLRLRLEEEVERAARYGRPLAVLTLDVGPTDSALRARIGAVLLGLVRLIDVAGWAGESHAVVVLPETPPESVPALAGRVLGALSTVKAGVRAGVASYPGDGADPDTLLAAAREAAAAAKPGALALPSEAAVTRDIGSTTVVVADPAMVRLFVLIERLAAGDIPVLITGETGSGKEIAAAALHHWSPRRAKPLVAINCAALQETLVESELFGYEKGAFSGAVSSKPGLLETASGGTVFLDEVGELSATAQAKLLRVLESKRVSRIGAVADREINIRVVAATNRDLEEMVAEGSFRQDLFYRLSVAHVFMPPLRDRARDLPVLTRRFLDEACERAGRPPMRLLPAAMQALLAHRWPGNVRELKNLLEYLVTVVEGDAIDLGDLGPKLRGEGRSSSPALSSRPLSMPLSTPASAAGPDASPDALPPSGDGLLAFRPIEEEIRELERSRMAAALVATGGNQTKAAELISMPLRRLPARDPRGAKCKRPSPSLPLRPSRHPASWTTRTCGGPSRRGAPSGSVASTTTPFAGCGGPPIARVSSTTTSGRWSCSAPSICASGR